MLKFTKMKYHEACLLNYPVLFVVIVVVVFTRD